MSLYEVNDYMSTLSSNIMHIRYIVLFNLYLLYMLARRGGDFILDNNSLEKKVIQTRLIANVFLYIFLNLT